MPTRMLGFEGDELWGPTSIEKETSANKDVGSRRGWIGGFHINWRRKRVRVRMLGHKEGVDCEIPHRLGRRTKHPLQ